MAEVFGVVAGAISILTNTSIVFSRIDELLQSVSNAPDTLQELRRDVQQTQDLLAQIGESFPDLSRSTEVSLVLSQLATTSTRLLEELPAPDLRTQPTKRSKLRMFKLDKQKLAEQAAQISKIRRELQQLLAQSPAKWEPQAISTDDFLHWLSAPQLLDSHEERHENSVVVNFGGNALDDDRFMSWVRTPGKALWYTGPAGSGKTVQFSITVDYLRDEFRPPNFVGHVYFKSQPLEDVDIVCSLIQQFLVAFHIRTIDGRLKEWYSRAKGNRSDYAGATAILAHLLQKVPRAFLLFDAIDEFPGHTEEFVYDLRMRMGRNPPNVLITSRQPLVSKPVFEDALNLYIQPRLEDISAFVSAKLSKMKSSLKITTEQEKKLVRDIVLRSSGSFLWTYLVLENLHDRMSHEEMTEVLSTFPSSLGEVYATTLDGITRKIGDSFNTMLRILTWLTYSNTRLKRDELEAALENNTERSRQNTNAGLSLEQFVDLARTLVSEQDDGSVVFVHSSVKEYLHDWLPTRLAEPSSDTTPNMLIARRCLEYLRQRAFTRKSLRKVDEIQERLAKYPFLRYAAVNWGHHARECCDKSLHDEILAFFEASFAMEAACLILGSCENNMEHYDEAYQRMTGIHLASAFGLHQVVEELLDTDLSDIQLETDGHWTAIHWAAWKGYERVVMTILSKLKNSEKEDLFKVLRRTTSLRSWTALHLAAKEGHLPVVNILHEYDGIKIDVTDLQRRTSLYLACWGKHVPVVRFLMQKGADPNLQDAFGMTALHCAVKGGNLQLVKEILHLGNNQLNLNIVDLFGHTSLDEAKRKGHDDIAQLLEDQGATSSSQNASRPLTVKLAESSIWKDIPRDTDWSCYELDLEMTRSTRKGAQATCEVLRNSNDLRMMVFRKAFKSTTELTMRGSETEHSETIQKYSLSEGQILYTLWHPHIVLYLDSDVDPERNTFNLYLEYCDSGDLRSIHGLPLKSDDAKTDNIYGFLDSAKTNGPVVPPLNGVQLWGLIWQLSSALAYLHYGLSMQHESGQLKAVFECDWEYIIHRDVKPENVVRKRTPDGKYVFKLCDLGIATPAGRYASTQNQTRYIGTRDFTPKEVFDGFAWSRKGDMYSLQALIRHTHKAKDDLVNPSNKSFDSFMSKCGDTTPSKRLTSLSIMELAHKELVGSNRIGELPLVVVEEIESVHDLLTCNGDDYLLGAVACVAGHLDVKIAVDDPLFKQHRDLTIQQLETIFADGAKRSFKSYRFQYSIHVLAVLHEPSSGKPNNGRVSSEYLEKALEVCVEPDSTLQQSGWTPLHLAAQQGNIEATEILLRYGADIYVKDIHKKTPYDYGLMRGMDLMMLKMGGLAVKG